MMICGTTKQPSGLWDAPASRASRREWLERAVEQSFFRHPVLMLTASMLVMGVGMLLAVAAFTLILALPLGLLLGWF